VYWKKARLNPLILLHAHDIHCFWLDKRRELKLDKRSRPRIAEAILGLSLPIVFIIHAHNLVITNYENRR
jgi:hypothetical protein